MEPIERALAKARHERGIGASPVNSILGKRSHLALSPIFTITRVMQADPTTMAREHIITNRSGEAEASVYRALRGQVLQWLAKSGKRTLAVTSVESDEGRTLTAVNLALALAMDVNQTVLLVDADLRQPDVHKKFGIQPSHGLDDYLQGAASIETCLINPGIERLVLLPARKPMNNCAELLASPPMVQLTKELRDRYRDRVIIYDAPSLLAHGDAIGFLPHVESVLLVVRDGSLRVTQLNRALELLKDCSVMGTVLNAAK
jgi:capsular exopolysaccharide synthesis family protein